MLKPLTLQSQIIGSVRMPVYKLCLYVQGQAQKFFYISLLTIKFPLTQYHWREQPTKVEVEKKCPKQEFLRKMHACFINHVGICKVKRAENYIFLLSIKFVLQWWQLQAKPTKIDHLHARTKEFINTLIAVTSRLDAVVTSMNVLNPMENR